MGKNWFSKLREMFSSISFIFPGFSWMSLFGRKVEFTEDCTHENTRSTPELSQSLENEILLDEQMLTNDEGGG